MSKRLDSTVSVSGADSSWAVSTTAVHSAFFFQLSKGRLLPLCLIFFRKLMRTEGLF